MWVPVEVNACVCEGGCGSNTCVSHNECVCLLYAENKCLILVLKCVHSCDVCDAAYVCLRLQSYDIVCHTINVCLQSYMVCHTIQVCLHSLQKKKKSRFWCRSACARTMCVTQ